MSDVAPFDPERLIRALSHHRVKFVLIGALAARLHGFPRLTADADITPADDKRNLERLAAALKELDARVYTESVPEGLAFDRSAAALGRARMWNLVTTAGRLDIAVEQNILMAREPARPSINSGSGHGRELFGWMRRAVGPADAGACALFETS